jgi:hypothetical protein
MTEQNNDATPLSAAVHAIHNLKQHREDPRNNPFPGEAIGILDRFVQEAGRRMAVLEAAAMSADIKDPAPFDAWIHAQLFADSPRHASPFNSWLAGREFERRLAALQSATKGGVLNQRALFEAWWQKGETNDVSAREAKLRVWYAALDAQPVGEFDISQEHRFDDWLKAGAPTARLTAAREKLKAMLDKPGVTSGELHEAYIEVSRAMPQDEKDQFFDVWEAALAAQ